RLLAVRDLAFPAWVDSSRHALITAVMSESGKVITDYSPYLPVTGFPYHYGFHTLSASLEMMTGMELHRLLLIFLQLLISLVPLTVFAGLDLITKRFWAALIAAFLVGIPFLFPGYYVTWGRMTQISAMVILPVGLAFTWLLIRGAKVWRKSWPHLSLLAGGLFLMHFRVFLLYLPFVLMVWILSKGREGRWLAAAAGLSLVLVAPRIFRAVAVLGAPGMSESIPGNNDFPTGYIDPGWELYFLIAAAMSLLLVLVAAARSRRWTWFPLLLALWSALVGLLLSGWIPGISEVPLLNLNSAYITFFLPLAWFLAVTFDRIILWLGNRSFAIQVVGWGLTGVLFAALLLYGIHQQINILNPQTILAWKRDESGLRWVEENLPPEAVVAVNSWQWQGSTWAGNDGGAWLIPMTGIKTTTPPVDYIYDEDLSDKVASFNAYASEVEDWSDPAQADWLTEQGVSHIYVGARGGFFDPSELANNPEISEIYRENGVFVFNLR
ncbi:MAG: hypothetical protein ACK2T3_13310, partial [Candidatus Promineifilaceae bacterium]